MKRPDVQNRIETDQPTVADNMHSVIPKKVVTNSGTELLRSSSLLASSSALPVVVAWVECQHVALLPCFAPLRLVARWDDIQTVNVQTSSVTPMKGIPHVRSITSCSRSSEGAPGHNVQRVPRDT